MFPIFSHSGLAWRCFVVGDVVVSLSSKGLRVSIGGSPIKVSQNHGTKSHGMVNACLNGECCGLEFFTIQQVAPSMMRFTLYNCFSNLPWMSNLLKKKQVSQQAKQSCSLPRMRSRQEKPWALPESKQSQPLMASWWLKVCRKVWKNTLAKQFKTSSFVKFCR